MMENLDEKNVDRDVDEKHVDRDVDRDVDEKHVDEKHVDETKLIQTIVLGSDWQEALENIVVEEGLDPKDLDIKALADSFTKWLQQMHVFSFRIPARFIIISAILLRMKCELLFEEEKQKSESQEPGKPIDISNIPGLQAPSVRTPTRKVTLNELLTALNKAMEFKERKEAKTFRMKRAVETLIDRQEDIEKRISDIFDRIVKDNVIKFSDLVPWKRKDIISAFIPMLYLCQREKITCEQPEMFKEIYIKVNEAKLENLHKIEELK